MSKNLKIGIFGGTFDPVHLGHTGCALAAAKQLSLDKVIFVPAGISNFKQDQNTAPRKDRLEMCRLAIDGYDKFEIDSYDIEREGISYTSDTVSYFHQRFTQAELYFITGSDAALTFDKWHKYHEILQYATLVVVTRKGAPVESDAAQRLQHICNNKVAFIEADVVDISSHELREMIADSLLKHDNNSAGKNVALSNYLSDNVLNYIEQKSLYS